MWKYVNNKCICAISLFISPILSFNWQSDLVVKDRQQFVRLGEGWWMDKVEGMDKVD